MGNEQASAVDSEIQVLRDPFQFCMVVPNVDASIKVWWERFGVGPWQIWTFDRTNMTDMLVEGEPVEYGMRIAMTHWGPFELEMVEPLDDNSHYAKSLRDHGGKAHFHHTHTVVDDYDEALERFAAVGVHSRMSGNIRGIRFSYLSTDDHIGTVIEIASRPDVWDWPPSDEVYPPKTA